MSEVIERGAELQAEESQHQRRPWSPPRVILSASASDAGGKTFASIAEATRETSPGFIC